MDTIKRQLDAIHQLGQGEWVERYDCTNCAARDLTDDEAFAHAHENHHCLVDDYGHEAFCFRADH